MKPLVPMQIFVCFCLITLCHQSQINHALSSSARLRRDAGDEKCKAQETSFLSTLHQSAVEKAFRHLWKFTNETKFTLSLTWSKQPTGPSSIIVVVTHEYMFGMFAQKSTVYRSTDDGQTFKNIDTSLPDAYIKKDNGIIKNPINEAKVTLVAHPTGGSENSPLWITEDGGDNWARFVAPFQLVSSVVFHPKQENWQLTLDKSRNLWKSVDGGKTWVMIKDKVVKFKWGPDTAEKVIYCLHDTTMQKNLIGQMVSSASGFTLLKTSDLGKQWLHIHDNIYTFGSQGKFLYASMFVNGDRDKRKMKVSTTEGRIWNEVQLPTITSDRFYSILDMSEDLVFMHVDEPGDTGHGTLYTSDSTGIIFSESLDRHLYPNYEDLTDFYRVESMRGVYMASQLAEDNSIHTVISFDRGAIWQPIRRPAGAPCKDESKACNLQIHNKYSQRKHIASRPPMSIKSAMGIILAHGHVADALQTTAPDVYVTSDGGYNWIKALDGPHDYQIADNGGLLVAVPTTTRTPNTVKFSTDEGRCWHEYKFTNQTIVFTGLLTEPGNKAMHMGIWGFGQNDHQWKVHLIDFSKIIPKQCDPTQDYESWIAHSEMSHGTDPTQQGCLLGRKENYQRLKLDSWCQNGKNYQISKTVTPCLCGKDDYECDFGFHRPVNKKDCVQRPGETEIVCLKGHEEEIKSKGYRKIPGDVCTGGTNAFVPPKDTYVNMMKACKDQKFTQVDVEVDSSLHLSDKGVTGGFKPVEHSVLTLDSSGSHLSADQTDTSSSTESVQPGHWLTIFICIATAICAVILIIFLVKKYLGRNRRDVSYKYSLLSKNTDDFEGLDYTLETGTESALYNDSEEEVDNTKTTNGHVRNGEHVPIRNGNAPKVRKYHDDSDDDLLD